MQDSKESKGTVGESSRAQEGKDCCKDIYTKKMKTMRPGQFCIWRNFCKIQQKGERNYRPRFERRRTKRKGYRCDH